MVLGGRRTLWFFHVARHVKNHRRIESAQRRFGVRTWWSSASSGGDGRPTATKVQPLLLTPHPLTPSLHSSPHPSLTPPLPSQPLPSPPPLLPPPRLIVEERGKGQRNFLFKPINARACGWSCSAVVCPRILRPSHTTTTHHGVEAIVQLVRSPRPKTEQWPAAPAHSAFTVMFCRAGEAEGDSLMPVFVFVGATPSLEAIQRRLHFDERLMASREDLYVVREWSRPLNQRLRKSLATILQFACTMARPVCGTKMVWSRLGGGAPQRLDGHRVVESPSTSSSGSGDPNLDNKTGRLRVRAC